MKALHRLLLGGGVAPQVGHVYIIEWCRATPAVTATVSQVALHCDTKHICLMVFLLLSGSK